MFKIKTFLIIFFISVITYAASQPNLYTVGQNNISQTLYYSGTISPIKNTPVISPTEGVVDQKNFIYGQVIQKNKNLLHIQSAKIQNDMREAQVAYLKALDDYQNKLNWNSSDDVINAQESLTKSKRALTESKNTWEENQKLYQLGIISLNDLNQSRDSYYDSQSSEKQSERALSDVMARGTGDNLTAAQLALQVDQDKYESLQAQVDAHTVLAPADGIILEPTGNQVSSSGNSQKTTSGKIDVGSSVQYQQVLMNIGDMSGLQINFDIPEININQINSGQPVSITGAGFPNIILQGLVSEVGAQASSSDGGSLPTFPAVAIVKTLTPEQKKWIRSGMDAQLAIQVYQENQQITVPIQAVTQNSKNQSMVQLYDPSTKKLSPQIITTGKIMATSVQVLSGLIQGEQIVLPS